MTYKQAEALFNRARDKEAGKPLPGVATRLFKRGENYAIRYHETDIVTIHPNNSVTLNSGGWRTMTTKAKMNEYAPCGISQANGVWYITYKNRKFKNWNGTEPYWKDGGLFIDGITVSRYGKPVNGKNRPSQNEYEKMKRKVDRMVSKYIKGFIQHITEHGLDDPSGGDCWLCMMHDADTGKRIDPHEPHYLDHFKERYYVPSLLANAIMERNYKDPGVIWHWIKGKIKRIQEGHNEDLWHARNALQLFFRKRKIMLVNYLLNK